MFSRTKKCAGPGLNEDHLLQNKKKKKKKEIDFLLISTSIQLAW